ncbi:MAG: hypothetical protein CMJ75_21045 [Planctomycetaceae bacterium]|nr:hypothetical protein [Planctomycetaceae bacterium]
MDRPGTRSALKRSGREVANTREPEYNKTDVLRINGVRLSPTSGPRQRDDGRYSAYLLSLRNRFSTFKPLRA